MGRSKGEDKTGACEEAQRYKRAPGSGSLVTGDGVSDGLERGWQKALTGSAMEMGLQCFHHSLLQNVTQVGGGGDRLLPLYNLNYNVK